MTGKRAGDVRKGGTPARHTHTKKEGVSKVTHSLFNN